MKILILLLVTLTSLYSRKVDSTQVDIERSLIESPTFSAVFDWDILAPGFPDDDACPADGAGIDEVFVGPRIENAGLVILTASSEEPVNSLINMAVAVIACLLIFWLSSEFL